MDYDIFICHVHEDKEVFVNSLANALKDKGLNVWYDDFELTIGDSLPEKIDQGLARSMYGVVFLSENFFNKKKWAQDELNALVGREHAEGRKIILPVWHNIDEDDVRKFSPTLAVKYAVNTSSGLDYVVSEILRVFHVDGAKHATVNQPVAQLALRKSCLDIIQRNDFPAWHQLIDEVTIPIPDELKKWKPRGEAALKRHAKDGGEEWKKVLFDAANICLPAFVPILASIELGQLEFWKQSLGILRQLSVLEDSMGGGFTEVLAIGPKMLSVAASLGMALAVQRRQLNVIDEWMSLPMPLPGQGGERPWHSIHAALRFIHFDRQQPFGFLSTAADSSHIQGFFTSKTGLVESLFMANLLQSLIEFRNCVQDQKCRETFLGQTASSVRLYVSPVWLLVGEPSKFRTLTLRFFGSSADVIDFIFPDGGVSTEQFWPMWVKWREVCADYIQSVSPRFVHLQHDFFRLPGEAS